MKFTKGASGGWYFEIDGQGYLALRNEAGFAGRDWMVFMVGEDATAYWDGFASRADAAAFIVQEHRSYELVVAEMAHYEGLRATGVEL
jgi:hypothetical protein